MLVLGHENAKQNAHKVGLSVRFNRKSIISDKFHIEERRGMWYRSRDFYGFRKDVKATIMQLRKLGFNTSHCLRGIEHLYSKEITKVQRKARKAHIQRVLLAQERQKIEGRKDPEELHFVSYQSSMDDLEKAQMLGEQDFVDAQDIFVEHITKQMTEGHQI